LSTSTTAVVFDLQLGLPTADDNLGSVTVARSGVPASNAFPIGTTTVTYTATDPAGNSASSLQRVVVKPAPPTLTAPGSTTSTNVRAGGTGAVGATVTVLDGATSVGTTPVTGAGTWSTSVTLGYGMHSLTAVQALGGQTSTQSAPANVRLVVPVAPSPTTVTAVEGSTVTGDVATFTADAADTYSATIEWGDAVESVGTVVELG